MQKIEVNKEFVFKCGAEELAKVLLYYGLIPDANSTDYKIVCPFHNDQNPSMIVNLVDGSFYCFACGVFGDAYHFVELANPKLNSMECMMKFWKILKSDKFEKLNFKHKLKKQKQSEELYYISWDYYFGLSKIDWEMNITKEVVESRKYMMKRGFYPKTLNECGAKVTYNKSYQIIFPMFDNDMFKGWVCRTTVKDIEKKRKYLYNEGFSRRNTLVGQYGDVDYVFIVEGYMDRLKFIQYGVKNVVAILGWKMTVEQEKKIKSSGVKFIISALDNDVCGEKGTEYLKTIFKNVLRFVYPNGVKDPGEMNRKVFKMSYHKTLNKLAHKRKAVEKKLTQKQRVQS